MILRDETCEEAVARLHRHNAVLAGRGDVNQLVSQLVAEQKHSSELENERYRSQQREAEHQTLAAWLRRRLGA